MGYSYNEVEKIILELEYYNTHTNVEMCEFGNNYIKGDTFKEWIFEQNIFFKEGGEQHQKGFVSKKFWEKLGFIHTSIDMNRLDGALYYDLRKRLPKELKEKFNFTLDVGTVEHIQYQYQCFKNIDYITKIGGTMIHFLPKVGSWPQHCSFYYDMENFKTISELCNYKVIRNEEYEYGANIWIYTVLQKTKGGFITENEFKDVGIHYVAGFAHDQGHYPYAY